jgi:hydroxymethylbilane synthase
MGVIMIQAAEATQPKPGRLPDHRALPLRVGTRGSPLALWQARHFIQLLSDACPGLRDGGLQEQIIATTGDAVLDRPLADIGGKGLFAKEIHEALLDGRIDIAVHSLKDLETELPRGIVLGCVLKREDCRDALILSERCEQPKARDPLAALPMGAAVGTSSVRRQAQLLHVRPDLKVVGMRGNVQTRLSKLRDGQCDATTLALAGLRRLGLDLPNIVVLEPEIMVPAAGQGIVGVTVRAKDTDLLELLAAIEDKDARVAATAERSLLQELDGSCRMPIGGHARMLEDGRLMLTGMVARADGSFLLTRSLTGRPADAERLGQTLGTSLRADSPMDIFD